MKEAMKNIDDIFSKSRLEEPRVSSEKVLEELQQNISLGKGESINNISTFKFFIMISTITILSITTLVFISVPDAKSTIPQDNHLTEVVMTNNTETLKVKSVQPELLEPIFEIKTKRTDTLVNNEKHLDLNDKQVEFVVTETQEAHFFSGKNNNRPTVTRPQILSTDAIDITKSRIFIIDQDTPREEINKIKAEAEKAGITFEYKTRSNGSIKKLKMVIINDNSSSTYKIIIDKVFTMEIGWIFDEETNSIRFYDREGEIRKAFEVEKDKINIEKTIIDLEKQVIKETKDWLKKK